MNSKHQVDVSGFQEIVMKPAMLRSDFFFKGQHPPSGS